MSYDISTWEPKIGSICQIHSLHKNQDENSGNATSDYDGALAKVVSVPDSETGRFTFVVRIMGDGTTVNFKPENLGLVVSSKSKEPNIFSRIEADNLFNVAQAIFLRFFLKADDHQHFVRYYNQKNKQYIQPISEKSYETTIQAMESLLGEIKLCHTQYNLIKILSKILQLRSLLLYKSIKHLSSEGPFFTSLPFKKEHVEQLKTELATPQHSTHQRYNNYLKRYPELQSADMKPALYLEKDYEAHQQSNIYRQAIWSFCEALSNLLLEHLDKAFLKKDKDPEIIKQIKESIANAPALIELFSAKISIPKCIDDIAGFSLLFEVKQYIKNTYRIDINFEDAAIVFSCFFQHAIIKTKENIYDDFKQHICDSTDIKKANFINFKRKLEKNLKFQIRVKILIDALILEAGKDDNKRPEEFCLRKRLINARNNDLDMEHLKTLALLSLDPGLKEYLEKTEGFRVIFLRANQFSASEPTVFDPKILDDQKDENIFSIQDFFSNHSISDSEDKQEKIVEETYQERPNETTDNFQKSSKSIKHTAKKTGTDTSVERPIISSTQVITATYPIPDNLSYSARCFFSELIAGNIRKRIRQTKLENYLFQLGYTVTSNGGSHITLKRENPAYTFKISRPHGKNTTLVSITIMQYLKDSLIKFGLTPDSFFQTKTT